MVEYDKVAIPKKPVFKPIWSDTSSIYEFEKKQFDEKLADWKNDYGNIYKLYALKRKNWELVSLELGGHYEYWRDEGLPVVCVSYIYPYAVGYFKDEFSYYYSYEPSVESALEYAFDFGQQTKNQIISIVILGMKVISNEGTMIKLLMKYLVVVTIIIISKRMKNLPII